MSRLHNQTVPQVTRRRGGRQDVWQQPLLKSWKHLKAIWVVRLSSDAALLAAAGYTCMLTLYDVRTAGQANGVCPPLQQVCVRGIVLDRGKIDLVLGTSCVHVVGSCLLQFESCFACRVIADLIRGSSRASIHLESQLFLRR